MMISVIIPTRFRIKELQDCIKSLESQSSKPDEILIIADVDDLDTEKFFKNYKTDNFKIQFLKSNGGTCIKRNLAIDHAKGDILVFLDDDVILHKDFIKNTKDIFIDEQVNLVTGYIFDALDLTNPSVMRRSDIDYILENPNDEFVNIIKQKVFHNSNVNVGQSYFFIKMFRNLLKSIFLLESPLKGKILPSGYRSEMPSLEKIKENQRVEWVFGGNFAVRKDVLRKFRFNESLEKYPYALNEDLEFSARVGKKYDIFLSPKMLLLHLRSPGRKIVGSKRYSCLVISTYLVAKIKGNRVAHRWSVFGLILNSILKLPFDKIAKDEIFGVFSGVNKIKELT